VLLFLVAALGTTLLATEAQEATPTTFKSAVLVNVPFSLQQRGDQNAKDTLDSVLRSLETQPFIAAAAVASMFRPLGAPRAFVIPGDQPSTENFAGLPCSAIVATNGIFDVLGLRLVAGRGFEQRDESGSLQVAVLNQALATRLFGTSEIVGQQIVAKSSEVDFGKATQYEVIGVVQNSRVSQGQPDQILYLPFRQHFTPNVSILVKGRRDDSTGLLRILNQTVIRVDPDLATTFAGTAESASRSLPNVAFGLVTNAAVGLGLVALVLAVVGLYGVLSHVVSRRTAEFGIRLALGADRVRIVRLVLVDGAKPVGQGLLIGLAVATIVRIGVASRFSRPIGSFEVLSAALATVPLLLCAALACYLPASRAGTVEPTVALRDS
jgi:ABC-type antimicrobial peptide transport system permease subunit